MNRIIILAALIAAPFAAPTLAQNLTANETARTVSHADLDLSRDADVRILDRRIRAAVRTVCGATSDADPAGKNEARRCRAETAASISGVRERAIDLARQPTRTALVH